MTTDMKTTLIEGWPLAVGPDGLATLIRDLDLAAKLHYARPRKLRERVARMVKGGKLSDVRIVPTVGRIEIRPGVTRPEAVDEFWLTLHQALRVIALSETSVASDLTDEMIRVFLAVPKMLADAEQERKRYVALCLRLEATDATSIWERDVINEICRICCKQPWNGDGRFPSWIRGNLAIIYRFVLGDMLWKELKARCPAPRYGALNYQFFTEAKLRMVSADMGTVAYMLRTSPKWDDFTGKMKFHYRKTPMQMGWDR